MTTVLVIDADVEFREELSAEIEARGWHVEAVAPAAVLAFLARYAVELIVLDLAMPLVESFKLAEALRRHPHGANAGLLMLSAHYRAASYRVEARRRFGVIDLLDKPVAVATVTSILQRHLDGAPTPTSPGSSRQRPEVPVRSGPPSPPVAVSRPTTTRCPRCGEALVAGAACGICAALEREREVRPPAPPTAARPPAPGEPVPAPSPPTVGRALSRATLSTASTAPPATCPPREAGASSCTPPAPITATSNSARRQVTCATCGTVITLASELVASPKAWCRRCHAMKAVTGGSADGSPLPGSTSTQSATTMPTAPAPAAAASVTSLDASPRCPRCGGGRWVASEKRGWCDTCHRWFTADSHPSEAEDTPSGKLILAVVGGLVLLLAFGGYKACSCLSAPSGDYVDCDTALAKRASLVGLPRYVVEKDGEHFARQVAAMMTLQRAARCAEGHWSPAFRRCVMAARTEAEYDDCEAKHPESFRD